MSALTLPTITGYQPFWSNILSPYNGGGTGGYAPTPVAQNGYRPSSDSMLARVLKRNKYRAQNAAFLALLGAAAGATATSTYKAVSAPTATEASVPQTTGVGDLGGLREIETITAINRATTAADITWLGKFFNDKLLESGITYPTVSGSGGGGKLVAGVTRF